jgi:DNA-binding response OmpR family regulator
LVREAIRNEKLSLEIHVASDGKQAVDFLARSEADTSAPCPDILVLDLNLPKMEGFDVLRQLRANDKYKNLKVLVVTSSDAPADRNEAARLGARYFRKPTSYEEYLKIGGVLKDLIQEAIG